MSFDMSIEDLITLFLSGQGKPIIECLVELGFAESKSEAKRSIQQGAVKLGKHKVLDINAKLFNFGGFVLVETNPNDGKIDITTKF